MKKILVIEDDEDIAYLISMVFEGIYLVEIKTDNDNIAETVKMFNPDLIILDNQLGQLQAADIIEELKRNEGVIDVPVVLVSGNENIVNISKNINAAACLSKPFGLEELKYCINKILG